jgi:hypothetical protein
LEIEDEIMAMNTQQVVRKTLWLEPEKLEKLCKLFETDSASEAVRQAIDATLASSEAQQAAHRIQRRGQFGRH